jgi:hypothetical protein
MKTQNRTQMLKEVSPYRMRLRPALIWPPSAPEKAPNLPPVVWKVERRDPNLHRHTESRIEENADTRPRGQDGSVHAMPLFSIDTPMSGASADLGP